MKQLIGKTYNIAGMSIQILSDDGDSYSTRNLTTGETVVLAKAMLESAIRLGKAEEMVDEGDQG